MMAKASPTRVPLDIGTIHFVGIGGIGMSGIAEIMHNLGYKVRGSDVADSANVKRLRDLGIRSRHRPQRRQSERRPRGGLFLGGQARQSGIRCRAQARPAAGAPRRDAGRDHAAEILRRRRRHQRQDHHHHAGGGLARCRRLRSHRGQWRHHQRLWHQCAPRQRRMGGGGGRRKRRHVPAPARDDRGGHQCRSRSSRLSTAPSSTCAPPSSASSRTCRSMVSRCCAWIIPKCRRWSAASRTGASSPMASCRRPMCARSICSFAEGASHFDVVVNDRRKGTETAHRQHPPAHAGRAQCAECAGRASRWRASSASAKTPSAPRSTRSKASSAASQRVGEWNGAADHRRLRPQPVQDRRRPEGRPPGLYRPGRRHRAAAPLSPACATRSTSSAPA